MTKTLDVVNVEDGKAKIGDVKVTGRPDLFRLLCKASSQSEGWMKSTKAMEVPGGCVVQVTTQQRNPDGSYAVAEAVCFVPGVKVYEDVYGGGKLTSF
jgi:hypothetical protein